MDGLLSYFTPEEQAMMQRQAQSQGLIGLGTALLQASVGQAGMPRPSLGQIIGQAAPAGLQAYQGGFDQSLRQIMLGQQLADAQRKRQAELTRERQLQELVANVPEGQRALASLFPERYAETQFAAPKAPEYSDMFKNAAITLYGTDKGPFTTEQRQAIEAKANQYRVEPQVAAAKATAAANLRDPLRLQGSAREVAKDFNKEIDPDVQVADRFNVIADSIANPTPIGDTAIIYSLAKIINPGEAIMEGDIRNILSNRSIPDAVKQAAKKAVSGENLTENERLEIQSVAWKIVQERKSRVDRKAANTAKQLENLGQSPSEYISNPYDKITSPNQIVVNFKGKKTVANKAQDGNYYIQVGNEFYKVNR